MYYNKVKERGPRSQRGPPLLLKNSKQKKGGKQVIEITKVNEHVGNIKKDNQSITFTWKELIWIIEQMIYEEPGTITRYQEERNIKE